MFNGLHRAIAHRRDPVVADHRLDWSIGFLWLLYGLWGILTPIVAENVVLATAPSFYPVVWGVCIGVCGLSAAGAVLWNLIAAASETVDSLSRRIASKRWEMFSVTAMGMFIAAHPVIQFFGLVSGQWDRFDTFALSFSYLIMPLWRVTHLFDRIRMLRTIRIVDGE